MQSLIEKNQREHIVRGAFPACDSRVTAGAFTVVLGALGLLNDDGSRIQPKRIEHLDRVGDFLAVGLACCAVGLFRRKNHPFLDCLDILKRKTVFGSKFRLIFVITFRNVGPPQKND